jgi:hypothetical protein
MRAEGGGVKTSPFSWFAKKDLSEGNDSPSPETIFCRARSAGSAIKALRIA